MSEADRLDKIEDKVQPMAIGETVRAAHEKHGLFLCWLPRSAAVTALGKLSDVGLGLYLDWVDAYAAPPSKRPRPLSEDQEYEAAVKKLGRVPDQGEVWRILREQETRVEVQVILDLLIWRWAQFEEAFQDRDALEAFLEAPTASPTSPPAPEPASVEPEPVEVAQAPPMPPASPEPSLAPGESLTVSATRETFFDPPRFFPSAN